MVMNIENVYGVCNNYVQFLGIKFNFFFSFLLIENAVFNDETIQIQPLHMHHISCVVKYQKFRSDHILILVIGLSVFKNV